ncbi:hypothetical protein CRG98_020161 [Punica granatum]|uniref:Major facilitator superfamily (MFS) profile domain-containing protein n=1 Tax=Punica granatum TaxID=22663 RepID=A0A2I0JT07_PUNGR|nr:hypothetical protein CRG98_020161 [Punica granatum]
MEFARFGGDEDTTLAWKKELSRTLYAAIHGGTGRFTREIWILIGRWHGRQGGVQEPLVHTDKNQMDDDTQKGQSWMAYFSTFIAVCGSYEFGTCAGYSSPTQSGIRRDLNLSLAEYSGFGSILTFGAMIGAITGRPIANFIGRKGTVRMASGFCVAGWLAIYFAEVSIFIAEIAPKDLHGVLTSINQAKRGRKNDFRIALQNFGARM